VRNWATVAHWSLFQSRCQRWNLAALPVNTLWTLACGSLRCLWCCVPRPSALCLSAVRAVIRFLTFVAPWN